MLLYVVVLLFAHTATMTTPISPDQMRRLIENAIRISNELQQLRDLIEAQQLHTPDVFTLDRAAIHDATGAGVSPEEQTALKLRDCQQTEQQLTTEFREIYELLNRLLS